MQTQFADELTQRVTDLVGIFRKFSHVAAAVSQLRFARALLQNWPDFLNLMLCRVPRTSSTTLLMRNQVAFEIPAEEGLGLVRSNIMYMLWDTWHDEVYTHPFEQMDNARTVVDAGANLGVFTAYAARRFPAGRVIALEPFYPASSYLRRNVALNRLSNVVCAQKGVLDERGRRPLWIHPENFGGHSVFEERLSEWQQMTDCEFITLDDILRDFGLESIDLLKLDIEGAEFPLVRGTSSNTFRKIHRIAMEYHLGPSRELNDLVAALGRVGYKTYTHAANAKRGMLWAAHDNLLVPA